MVIALRNVQMFTECMDSFRPHSTLATWLYSVLHLASCVVSVLLCWFFSLCLTKKSNVIGSVHWIILAKRLNYQHCCQKHMLSVTVLASQNRCCYLAILTFITGNLDLVYCN